MIKKVCSNFVAFLLLLLMFDVSLFRSSNWNILFCVLILGISVFLIILNQIKKFPLYVYAFLAIFLLGMLSVFIQPICNIPDEHAHLARSEYLSEGKFFVNQEIQEFDTIQSISDMIDEVKTPFDKSKLKGQNIDFTLTTCTHIAASNPSIEYIPQAIGVSIAKVLGLNALWMMWLGRFTNLLFYVFLVCLGIKIAPSCKMILLFVAMLPMSIQQAASLSPDAMINGLAILTIGYFMFLFDKNNITKHQLMLFWILCILITVCKVTNICFGGLILLLPDVEQYPKRKQLLSKSCLLFLVGIAGCAYYYYTLQFSSGLWCQEYLVQNNVNSGAQLSYIIHNFGTWIRSYIYSIIVQIPDYLAMLNHFGWFEVGCSIITPVMIFLYARCCSNSKSSMTYWEKSYILLLFCGIYFLTNIAMYLGWTPVGAVYTSGVQGRYFIPALVLVSLYFYSSPKKEIAEKSNNTIQAEEYDIWIMILMTSYYLFSLVAFYYK